MNISIVIKDLLEEQRRTQKWTIERMNQINGNIKMDRTKFSAILHKKRKMTCDEFLAFCMALEISPDVFIDHKQNKAG